jgi:hypothetical protein
MMPILLLLPILAAAAPALAPRSSHPGTATSRAVAGGRLALPGAPPDLILHHGKIVTVDPQFRIVEAMAVRGDRKVYPDGNVADYNAFFPTR